MAAMFHSLFDLYGFQLSSRPRVFSSVTVIRQLEALAIGPVYHAGCRVPGADAAILHVGHGSHCTWTAACLCAECGRTWW